MPEKTPPLPLLLALHHRAAKARASLEREIAQREQELLRLKAEAERWRSVLGEHATRMRVPRTPPGGAAPRRVEWSTVLQELPMRFTTKEVAKKAQKPLAHVYTSISRWMKEKKVRRVAGGYQKISTR